MPLRTLDESHTLSYFNTFNIWLIEQKRGVNCVSLKGKGFEKVKHDSLLYLSTKADPKSNFMEE